MPHKLIEQVRELVTIIEDEAAPISKKNLAQAFLDEKGWNMAKALLAVDDALKNWNGSWESGDYLEEEIRKAIEEAGE